MRASKKKSGGDLFNRLKLGDTVSNDSEESMEDREYYIYKKL